MPINEFPVASYVILGLFAFASFIHLVFCFLEKEKLRKITKPIPLVCLIAFAAVTSPDKPLIYLGALCYLAGDVALLKKHKVRWFIAGALAFMVGHLLFISEIIRQSGGAPYYFYLIALFFLVGYSIVFYRLWGKLIRYRYTRIAAIVYSFTLLASFLTALIAAIITGMNNLWLVAAGYFLFLVSDSVLALTLFKKDVKRRDFYIMLTYLSACFLVVFGLLVGGF